MARIIPEGTIAMKKYHFASELIPGWQTCDAVVTRVLWKAPCRFWACTGAIVAIMIGTIHVNNTSTNLSHFGACLSRFNTLKRNEDHEAQ